MKDTSTRAISSEILRLRSLAGAVTLGHVMTLLIPVEEADAAAAMTTAVDATMTHPSRMLVFAVGDAEGPTRLDAELRVGSAGGSGEVISLVASGELVHQGAALVTPFLLPDTPIVCWWPTDPPISPSATELGSIASRRITDMAQAAKKDEALANLASTYSPGDTDLAWSRITHWRQLLAHLLDDLPSTAPRIIYVTVSHAADSPSGLLLAAWLRGAFRCEVRHIATRAGSGVKGVCFTWSDNTSTEVTRDDAGVVTVRRDGSSRSLSMPPRSDSDCLNEELGRLAPDDIYEEVLRGAADH